MIQKLLSRNTTYILPAALLLLLGQFLYLDAANRVATAPQPVLAENNEEVQEFSLFSLSGDTLADSQVAAVENTFIQEPAILETTKTEDIVEPQENATPVVSEEDVTEAVTSVEENITEATTPTVVTLPYLQTIFQPGIEWGGGYGTFRFLNDRMEIGGGDTDTASLVLLENGYELEDYTFSTVFDWNRGASYTLVARFADYDNFVTCSFVDYGAQVSIVSQINGERVPYNASPTLKTKSIEAWKDLTFGIRVFDNVVECLKEGEVVLRNTLPYTPEKGTVGISIWAPNEGEALVSVKKTEINK